MTLIIVQVMRSSLYTGIDDNLKALSQSPSVVADLAYRTMGQQNVPKEVPESEGENANKPSDIGKTIFSSNTFAVLLDDKFKNVLKGNGFLDISSLKFDKNYLDQVKPIVMTNNYGQTETYRAYLFDIDPSNKYANVEYAVVMTSISQLEQTSRIHEQLIAIIMVSFWGISLLASIYLAKMSVKPLLESMQKQKSFVENASHELRTPLAVLQNRLESLFRKPEATIMASSESIASSLDEVRNMRILTTNLLNIARRDDVLTPVIDDVEPSFFDITFANYDLIAKENSKILYFENLVPRTIMTDRTLLKQLMTILFDNAIKYTDKDGAIRFSAIANERSLVLRVSDNGPGVANEDKKKIFDRFYRVDKARTRQKGGFGLGLSLAKQIVGAFKGSITVKDNKPKGTIFEVKIPIKADNKKWSGK